MTITYTNGQTIQAALVVRTDNRLRVVLAGSDDVTEFTQVSGATLVSEDCEAVQIEFGPKRANRECTEEDCICSPELAARLIHMLLNPEEDEDLSTPIPSPSLDSTAERLVV
jgi:hypothetical protein